MEKLDGKTADIVDENIQKLKQIFPEAFTENKVDFEMLQSVLGENIETEKERYSFNWNGKSEAIKIALKQSTGTLRPAKESSKNWDDTQNLYIEGDNLEVLRILQSSYRNKIKMIYIDPPYNTGKDFVYSDKFNDTVDDYKERVGEKYKTNANTSGRYHTNWLNMMYPRLKLARNLLTEDGVIFISIDDNEQANLKKVCDEIFGEENFVIQITWRKSDNQANIGKIARVKEYILAYSKSNNELILNKIPLTEKAKKEYSYKDEKGAFRRSILLDKTRGRHFYDVVTRSGKVLKGPWMIAHDKFNELDSKGKVLWTSGGDEQPYGKIYLADSGGQIANDFWGTQYGSNQEASLSLEKLFEKRIFDFPKSTKLLSTLINIGSNSDSVVLDFFSGSGASAHATMQLNVEDGGSRKFVMVQLPEETDEKSEAHKAGYETIADIGRERIRRAGEKILEENKEEFAKREIPLDVGFKAFKLDSTNLSIWDEKTDDVEKTLLDNIEAVKKDRTDEDVLYEVLLKYGVDITVPIEEEELDGKKVYKIAGGYLTICLEDNLDTSFIEKLAERKPERVVFRDSGFKDDTVKVNAEMTLKKHGVEDIKVL